MAFNWRDGTQHSTKIKCDTKHKNSFVMLSVTNKSFVMGVVAPFH
jgi:hypothetical protein